MSVVLSLASMFGAPLAESLMKRLVQVKDGQMKLDQVATLMEQGTSTVDALKKIFGTEFFSSLNSAVGLGAIASFTYEAGIDAYIRINDEPGGNPIRLLKDELNINLDRLSALKTRDPNLSNIFNGLMAVWQQRCYERLATDKTRQDIEKTFATIDSVLSGEVKNFKEMFQKLSSTALGGVGGLMVISGVMVATSTGVGLGAAISAAIFGVPMVTVGAFVIPGALLVMLAAKKTKPQDQISISVDLAYKLLGRLDKKMNSRVVLEQ